MSNISVFQVVGHRRTECHYYDKAMWLFKRRKVLEYILYVLRKFWNVNMLSLRRYAAVIIGVSWWSDLNLNNFILYTVYFMRLLSVLLNLSCEHSV